MTNLIKSDAAWARLRARARDGTLLRRSIMESRPGVERARIAREKDRIARERASKQKPEPPLSFYQEN